MKELRKLMFLIVLAAVVAVGLALGSGTAALGAPVPPGFCPKVLAPVACDDGRTFDNPCLADCAGATNCVFIGVQRTRP